MFRTLHPICDAWNFDSFNDEMKWNIFGRGPCWVGVAVGQWRHYRLPRESEWRLRGGEEDTTHKCSNSGGTFAKHYSDLWRAIGIRGGGKPCTAQHSFKARGSVQRKLTLDAGWCSERGILPVQEQMYPVKNGFNSCAVALQAVNTVLLHLPPSPGGAIITS